MNKYLPIALVAIAAVTLFTFHYETEKPTLEQGLKAFLLQNLGENKQVLARTGNEEGDFGETVTLEAADKEKGMQQAYLQLPMQGRDNTYRFVQASDSGAALALTAYQGTNEVYEHSNLIEDKLLKWWEVKEVDTGVVLLQNISTEISNTYLCGTVVMATSEDPSCKWKLVETDLPFIL